MQAMRHHLLEIMNSGGQVSATALPELKALVDRYPYYHVARIALLRLLFQQRAPEFSDELRRAALYLPSRETIFNYLEADHFRPREEKPNGFSGATVSRKPNERLGMPAGEESRTNLLIDGYLGSLTPGDTARQDAPLRRGKADATQDYIDYMLQEELEMNAASASATEDSPVPPVDEEDKKRAESVEEPSSMDRVGEFLQRQGDKKIKLKDKSDSELVKPILDLENSQEKGVFTETLARIYIKQGKFEHAIAIIRRLSLKYPKKNRYFADQIRFLEKIVANNKASKSEK